MLGLGPPGFYNWRGDYRKARPRMQRGFLEEGGAFAWLLNGILSSRAIGK
jgi:hypothetical protein